LGGGDREEGVLSDKETEEVNGEEVKRKGEMRDKVGIKER